MNNHDPRIPTDELQQDALPGLEHVDMRFAEDDYGTTWVGDLYAAVRRRSYKFILWILFCFLVSLAYVQMAKPEYVASAQIALEPRVRVGAGVADAAAVAPILDSAQAESQLQIVRSVRNLSYVFDTLKLASDPEFVPTDTGSIFRTVGGLLHLLSDADSFSKPSTNQSREVAFQKFFERVQVRRIGQSYVIEVSFRGAQPETTARITNSIAAAYIRDQVLVRASSEQRGTEFLQGRIALIQAQKKAADEAVVSGVIPDYPFPDSDARIVGAALRPLAASYPQTKIILLFGVVFGFVTGVAFVAVANNFDRTVRSPAQIRRVLGVDCLVQVPRVQAQFASDTSAIDRPESDFAHSMRLLRTVLFAGRARSLRGAVGFVSCQEGEGCSMIIANLAVLLAASNNRVLLIDASLQKPDLTMRLAPDSDAGLDQFVLSFSESSELPEVKLSRSLSFVPAVAANHTADPNTFLGTQAMRAVLTQHGEAADILIDLSPLRSSSNAQAVGSMLSGVVLVAAVNRTGLDELSEAIRALRSANSRVLGLVLNDPPPRKFWRQSAGRLRAPNRTV